MKIQKWAASVFDGILNCGGILAGILCGLVMLLIVGIVIARYGLHMGQAWAIEVSQYSLFFITFLGTAWVLRKERHVKMDVLVMRFTPRTQAMIGIIISSMCVIMMGIVTCYSIEAIKLAFERGYVFGHGLKPPMGALLWAIPFGTLTLLIQFARRTYGFLKMWRTPTTPEAMKKGDTVGL